MKLDEQDIKIRFIQEMRARRVVDRTTLIASEYVLGENGTRADLVFLKNAFIGVEIKSDYDSLYRLKNQIDNYNKCFDKTIIVVACRHIKNDIFNRINAEIWTVDGEGKFSLVKDISQGKSMVNINAHLAMLPMSKLRKLLNLGKKVYVDRTDLISAAQTLPSKKIYDAVIENFRESYTETSDKFWASLGRRKVNLVALEKLSRFHAVRQARQQHHIADALFWEDWKIQASEALLEGETLNQSIQLPEKASPACSAGTYEYSYAQ